MDRVRKAAASATWYGPAQPADYSPLRTVNPVLLQSAPIPERRWIVPDWLPCGHTTIAYGSGGIGKTLLAQQLMTACALGLPWCGLRVEPCRSFALFCEDDEDELHRRQEDILAYNQRSFDELGDMRWASGVGQDNTLIRFDRDGAPVLTDRFEDLKRQAAAFGARLVIIDTAADTFGGNENDRAQVRQFIGLALNGLARAIDGAVLLNAHPSRSGMSAIGDGDGGSTAWSNTARSRWSLTRPTPDGDSAQADPDERVLARRKANYASVGDTLKLRWQKGVMITDKPTGTGFLDAAGRAIAAEQVFLDLLAKSRGLAQNLSSSSNSTNYAPRILAKRPDARGYSKREFEGAMHKLFAVGKIRMEGYGRSGDARSRIVITPDLYAGRG